MLSAATVYSPVNNAVRQLTPTPRTADHNGSNLNIVLCEKLRASEPQYLDDIEVLLSKLGPAHPLSSIIEEIYTAHSSALSLVNELDVWLTRAAPLYERYISVLENGITDRRNFDRLTKIPLIKLKDLTDFVASEGFELDNKSIQQYLNSLASRVEVLLHAFDASIANRTECNACFDKVISLETLEPVSATFDASSVMAETTLEFAMDHPLERRSSKPARALLIGNDSKLAGLALCSEYDSETKLLFPVFRRGDLRLNSERSTARCWVLQTSTYSIQDSQITLSLRCQTNFQSNDFWNNSLRELFDIRSANQTTELFDYRVSSPARAIEITLQRQVNAKAQIIEKKKKSSKNKDAARKVMAGKPSPKSSSPGRGLGIQFNLEHPPVPSAAFSDELDAILGGSGPDTTLSFQKRPPSLILKPHYYKSSPPLSTSKSTQRLDSLEEIDPLERQHNEAYPSESPKPCTRALELPPLPLLPSCIKSAQLPSGNTVEKFSRLDDGANLLSNVRPKELTTRNAPISTSSSPLLNSPIARAYPSGPSLPSPNRQLSQLQASHSHMVKQNFARRPSANRAKTAPVVSSEFETVPLSQPEVNEIQPTITRTLLHRPKDSSPVFDDDSEDEAPHREHGHFMRKVSGGLKNLHQRWRSKPLKTGTVRQARNRQVLSCTADIFDESDNDDHERHITAASPKSNVASATATSECATSESVEKSCDISHVTGSQTSLHSTVLEVPHIDEHVQCSAYSEEIVESVGTAVYANSHNATVETGSSFSSLKSMSKSSSGGSYESTMSEPLSPYTNVTTKTSATSISDRSVIFRGSAYVSQWHESRWLQLSKSALRVEISVSSEGCAVAGYDVSTGKMELELYLGDTSTTRKSTVLDVQILQSGLITMFRLRNVREAGTFFESLKASRYDFANQSLLCGNEVENKFQAPSLSSDSSLESINGAVQPPFAIDSSGSASPSFLGSPCLPNEQLALPPLLHGRKENSIPSPSLAHNSPVIAEPTLLLLSNLRCKWYSKSPTGEWSKDGMPSRISVFSVPGSTMKRILVRQTTEHSSKILFDREVRARCFQRVGKCGISIRVEYDHAQEADVLHMIQFRGDKETRYVNELLTSE